MLSQAASKSTARFSADDLLELEGIIDDDVLRTNEVLQIRVHGDSAMTLSSERWLSSLIRREPSAILAEQAGCPVPLLKFSSYRFSNSANGMI